MEAAFPQITDAPGEVSREKLAQDLRVLIRDAEALLKAGATEAGGKMEELKSRLQASVGRVKDTCQDLEQKVVAGAKATDKVIPEHPFWVIRVAFGVRKMRRLVVTPQQGHV